jgi:hypothetical protein
MKSTLSTITWNDTGERASLPLDRAAAAVASGLARFTFPTAATGMSLAKVRAERVSRSHRPALVAS